MRKPLIAMVGVVALGALALTGCTQKNTGGTDSTGDAGASADAGAGKKVSVAFVPKLQGIPYFDAMDAGGKKAAAELGFEWIYKGGTTADPATQTDIVKSLIQQGVSAIIVAPNDPDSMAPILQEAKDKGIAVLTSDTDAPNSVREAFVNQATSEGIGTFTVDTLAKAMGEEGEWAIVSCGQTAANLNSWIEIEKSHATEKYPKMKLVDTVYAGEDQAKAVTMSKDLMNAHPNLKGLVGQCTTSAPGVAQAVQEQGKTGKVFTVGVGTPKSMLPYLTDGSSSGSILWDVENLGYLSGWAGFELASGKEFQADNNVSADLPDVKWTASDKQLLLGDPLVLTKENAGNYDY